MRYILLVFFVFILSCNFGKPPRKLERNNSFSNGINKIKVFCWEEELCSYTAKYDSTIVKYRQLKNTYDFGYISTRFSIQNKTTAYRKAYEIDQLNVDSLDCECSRKLKDLRSLEIINTKYWQDLKGQKIKELEQECKLSRLAMLAYKFPDTLKSAETSSECDKYVIALTKGGDALLKAWKEFRVEYAVKHGENKTADEKFEKDYNSIDRFKYAQIDLITFGWWNCINQAISRAKNDDFHNEFRKIFIEIKEKCTEP